MFQERTSGVQYPENHHIIACLGSELNVLVQISKVWQRFALILALKPPCVTQKDYRIVFFCSKRSLLWPDKLMSLEQFTNRRYCVSRVWISPLQRSRGGNDFVL